MATIDEIMLVGTNAAIIALVILLIPTALRVFTGVTPADRLQAVDAVTTLLIGLVVLLAVILDVPLFLDVGIALAALSFIGTMTIARYLGEGKIVSHGDDDHDI